MPRLAGDPKSKSPKTKKKVTGAIGSALRRKQYDELGWKYDKTIKANPKAKTVSKIKTQKVDAKSGGATTVKGAQTKAKALLKDNPIVDASKRISKLASNKGTSKARTKSEAKEGRQNKRAAAKKGRVNKRVKRLENRVERVSLKGKQATEAGKTGANSRARDLVAKKARLQKRIDNKKNK